MTVRLGHGERDVRLGPEGRGISTCSPGEWPDEAVAIEKGQAPSCRDDKRTVAERAREIHYSGDVPEMNPACRWGRPRRLRGAGGTQGSDRDQAQNQADHHPHHGARTCRTLESAIARFPSVLRSSMSSCRCGFTYSNS